MASMTFTIPGNPSVIVNVTEAGGDLKFDLSLSSPTGKVADFRGLFFHVADESLLSGLSVSGSAVTDRAIAANKVADLGNGANVQGVKSGPFDIGVEFGTSGIGKDDVQSTSFVLSHATESLTLDLIGLQTFAARINSVGTVNSGRGDSLKLSGPAPAAPDCEDKCPFADAFEKDPSIVYTKTINGTAKNDKIEGGSQNEKIFGNDGDDVINGNGGSDLIDGGRGNDRIKGNQEADYLIGGVGKDTIGGDGGDDTIFGGANNDNLHGGEGNDALSGGTGNDYIDGEGGKDSICGGAGHDTIFGSYNDDQLFGGCGEDTFLFVNAPDDKRLDTDTIWDFDTKDDCIKLDGRSVAAIDTSAADQVVITLNGDGDKIVLLGLTPAQAGDIHFC